MKSITRIFFHAENHVAIQGLELHFVKTNSSYHNYNQRYSISGYRDNIFHI